MNHGTERDSNKDKSDMITEAAIIKNGVIYTGYRHDRIICDKLANRPKGFFKCCTQGFITDKGTFLDRKQAIYHAILSGQIKDTGDLIGSVLTSEDLW